MDKQIFDGTVKMYVHDDEVIEIYAACPSCDFRSTHFIPIAEFSEALARARSFLAGVRET